MPVSGMGRKRTSRRPHWARMCRAVYPRSGPLPPTGKWLINAIAVAAHYRARRGARGTLHMINNRRFDPYKGFRFRALFASALAGAAALGIVKKLLRGASASKPVESDTGARPIEGVGTSTAGFVGNAPKPARKARRAPARGRKQPRKTKGTR